MLLYDIPRLVVKVSLVRETQYTLHRVFNLVFRLEADRLLTPIVSKLRPHNLVIKRSTIVAPDTTPTFLILRIIGVRDRSHLIASSCSLLRLL